MTIPPPPPLHYVLFVMAAYVFLMMMVSWVTGCAQPHRFDPLRQQQLQQQQDACLKRGGNPRECRP